ncbi:Lcl C-terminal domain-containing protein [Thiolapillus sp.]
MHSTPKSIFRFTGFLCLYSSALLAGDIRVEGDVTATSFIGSGTALTGVVKTEVDPVVDTLVADKWCKADATGVVIQCDQDAPSTPVWVQLWVPKTGQTQCWDEAGASRSCSGTGEDGEYRKGGRTVEPVDHISWHPSFRATPRFTDNADGTVTDNLTGLIWLKNANCIADNTGFDNDGAANDGSVTWQHGLDFVRGMNTGLYNCGDTSNGGVSQTDWRMPNFNELLSLTDPSQRSPALSPGNPFTGMESTHYWTSTTLTLDYAVAWVINMGLGIVNGVGTKTLNRYVLPVRGGQ